MKLFISIVSFLVSNLTFSQQSEILISNKENFQKSIFSKVNLKKEVVDTIIKVKIIGEGKYLFNSKKEKELLDYDMSFTTAISFSIKGDTNIYYYPIGKKVLKKILNKKLTKKEIDLKFSLCKNEPFPIIYISGVHL